MILNLALIPIEGPKMATRGGMNGSLKFLSKTLVLGSIYNPKSILTQEASNIRANR
jgi:hypothetical protein